MWIKVIDEYPTNGWNIIRIIGSEKTFPAMFAPHIIAGVDGKIYKKEEIEYYTDDSKSLLCIINALNIIANPMQHFQNEAKERGEEINGVMAIQLSNDPQFLKNIAKQALEKIKL